jgi:hypothetical protein
VVKNFTTRFKSRSMTPLFASLPKAMTKSKMLGLLVSQRDERSQDFSSFSSFFSSLTTQNRR